MWLSPIAQVQTRHQPKCEHDDVTAPSMNSTLTIEPNHENNNNNNNKSLTKMLKIQHLPLHISILNLPNICTIKSYDKGILKIRGLGQEVA